MDLLPGPRFLWWDPSSPGILLFASGACFEVDPYEPGFFGPFV